MIRLVGVAARSFLDAGRSRNYHATSITRNAVVASRLSASFPVGQRRNQQKYQPLFEDPFAQEQLQRSTIYAISDIKTSQSPVMRIYGYHSLQAFEKLTGMQIAAESTEKPLVSRLQSGDHSPLNAIVFFKPASNSGPSVHDSLEVFFNPSDCDKIREMAAKLGPDFTVSDDKTFLERTLSSEKPLVSLFPEVKSILATKNEPHRREALRKNGLGLAVLYQAWDEEIEKYAQIMAAQIIDGAPETRQLVSDLVRSQISRIMESIQQHLNDDRRVSDFSKGINISIVGPPNAGKSTLLNLLSQKYISKVDSKPGSTTEILDQRLNIDEVPVAFTDTVGLSAAAPDLAVGLKRTMQRLDSGDLKICVLDMKEIYNEKSTAAIDRAVIEAIDSDTIILINKRDLVNIRIPAPPAKIRYKNSPLGPQGDVKRSAFRGTIPLRLDGDTTGNTIKYGDYGLRVLEDVRLTEACLQECRSTLHRHIKNIRGARFWLRVLPDHPVSSKPVGVRMGKGKGAFDHWEAKVPNKKIVFEIGGGVREDVARDILRIVGTRVSGKTEFVIADKEETVEEMSRRIREFSKVPPLGIWCISCETGEGVEEFLGDLSRLIRELYELQQQASDQLPQQNLVSMRMDRLQRCSEQLSSMLSSTKSLPDVKTITAVSASMQSLVEQKAVRDAMNFMYHSKYGVLYKNAIQSQP